MHLSEQTGWDYVRAAFQRIWGYDDFRPPQGEIIHSLLAHQDALVVMPTGGGKSICFQLPALLRTGLTLVVSPLVALMENQVQELHQRSLPAALLHGELPSYQRRQTLLDVQRQHLRLLYLSPETLLSPPVWEVLCQPHLKINGLILDEAHCLVQWGDTFRPTYRRLGAARLELVKRKPPNTRIGIAAFTATADPHAQGVIQDVLGLKNPDIFRLNPYRSNLHLAVQTTWTPRGRRQQLLKFIRQHPEQAGLVYVRTRRDSESLATWLSEKGYKTAAYHAGLSPDERRYMETAWLKGDLQFVVCTSAFGMGINKPDVRWVIHFHAPMLLSEYVQEVGRAGRDGKAADALTLVSEPTGWLDPEDKQRLHFFQERVRSQQRLAQELVQQLPTEGDVNTITTQFKQGAIALSLLHSSGQLNWQDPFHYVLTSTQLPQFPKQEQGVQQMLQFLTTSECRWKFLLQAFGFGDDAKSMRCGHCDRCLSR
ncbi:ATP-dependent DNA helicase RecQ [Oscillatoria sp. FACHB-1407]|uniref:RecQ family ATP-dependent DNA helicase n=1 Tax=Oscillatoria sp. FACHB-1407 TaxID=2692847 RepID=UPI0016867B22|nr:ATP-dependent DNA helicase RecQ [Oscillatoria sp. FACHB-1407]MBD2462918.1 ATP-dependent DNA helicase RecQ [Oscillatoria sp. FACHB-1407]